MLTFLPYANFDETARCLDRQRLNSQRREAWLIQRAVLDESNRFHDYVYARMWHGHAALLGDYGDAIIREWLRRGYVNNLVMVFLPGTRRQPSWLGDERLHGSHRARLLDKDPQHYRQFGWQEKPAKEYFWPK